MYKIGDKILIIIRDEDDDGDLVTYEVSAEVLRIDDDDMYYVAYEHPDAGFNHTWIDSCDVIRPVQKPTTPISPVFGGMP